MDFDRKFLHLKFFSFFLIKLDQKSRTFYGFGTRSKIALYRSFRVIQRWVKKISITKILKLSENYKKKDVNRDSDIASSPISQSHFFEEVRCLAPSQRKLCGYIEFLKFDVKITKIKKIQIRLKLKGLDWFSQNRVSNNTQYQCIYVQNFSSINRNLPELDNFVLSNLKNSMYPQSLLCAQNQTTHFLKEKTLWNRWGSNMGIPIHILF